MKNFNINSIFMRYTNPLTDQECPETIPILQHIGCKASSSQLCPLDTLKAIWQTKWKYIGNTLTVMSPKFSSLYAECSPVQ